MTREEAIEIIKNYDVYSCGYCHQGGDEVREAFDMAIEALEQESCGKDINVPATDAINRQAVNALVDELARAISDERCFISRGRSTATIMQDILDLPPVTPQPKTGHWIYIGNSEINGLKICKCSNCEKKTYGSHKFCPNCGANMAESEG